MNDKLLIRRPGDTTWRIPATSAYQDEAALQELLQRSPELLQDGEPLPLVVVREVHVPGTGPVDLLGIDASGGIYVVECKLRANPEIRRHVIGQLFAYASGLWRLAYADFDRLFTSRAAESLTDALARRVADTGDDAFSEDAFKSAIDLGLQQGRFNLVLAVDQITEELKRIVEYINSLTVPDVSIFALELRYLADADVQILQPRTYGKELARSKSASRPREDHDWATYADMGVPAPRLEVGRALVDALEKAIAQRGAPWTIAFRKGYIAVLRPGGYKVAVVDVYWRAAPRFAIKLPRRPEELGLADPFGGAYAASWGESDQEWGWTVQAGDNIPDVGVALDLAAPYHPDRGPMTAATST